MQPEEVKAARHALDLSVAQLAEALRLSPDTGATTVREWERGKRAISGPAAAAIDLMLAKRIDAQRVHDALQQSDDEHYPNERGWIDFDELSDVLIDGRYNLERVAEILSGRELVRF